LRRGGQEENRKYCGFPQLAGDLALCLYFPHALSWVPGLGSNTPIKEAHMRSTISHSGLVAFIVEGARADSSRSLHLLRAIEDTVASNEVLANTFETISRNASDVAHAICRSPASERQVLDREGVFQAAFDDTLDVLAELGRMLEEKRLAALADHELQDGDGVVESFDKAIIQVKDAFSHLHDLKWAVMENDADVAAVVAGGPQDDVEAFLKSLGR
jgi:hypothetical protein